MTLERHDTVGIKPRPLDTILATFKVNFVNINVLLGTRDILWPASTDLDSLNSNHG